MRKKFCDMCQGESDGYRVADAGGFCVIWLCQTCVTALIAESRNRIAPEQVADAPMATRVAAAHGRVVEARERIEAAIGEEARLVREWLRLKREQIRTEKVDYSHGIGCKKVPHVKGRGYLHDAKDDAPYDVDGLLYCGRCHVAL